MINLLQQNNVVGLEPTTKVRLYSGVPWDDRYKNVRLYKNVNDLLTHLENWRVLRDRQLENVAPVRVGDYDIRLPFTEMQTLGVNYLAFCNSGLSDEWVFCFVTDIKWLSQNTTRLSLELDVFQNNFYKLNVKPCFIEYQHIPKSDDLIGANQIPVNLETGEMVVSDFNHFMFTNWHICMYATESPTGADFAGKVTNNIYRGASLGHWAISEKDTEDTVNNLISDYNDAGKIDAIIALFMSPDICVNAIKNDGSNKTTMLITPKVEQLFGGYKPKNNKVYSYPFMYLLVDNNEGQQTIHRFELSDRADHAINYRIAGCMNTLPQVITYPIEYKGIDENYNEGFVNSGFPQCGYSSDTFRAWIAQNKSSLGLSAMSSALTTLSGGTMIATGNLVGGGAMVSHGINQTLGLLGEIRDKSRMPATARGKTLSDNINATLDISGVCFYTMSCRREFAEIADNFFTMYGYPINKIEYPKLNSRSTWNYVKTQQCGFTGAVDFNSLQKIREIFDTGVTLWHTDNVGDYSLENN